MFFFQGQLFGGQGRAGGVGGRTSIFCEKKSNLKSFGTSHQDDNISIHSRALKDMDKCLNTSEVLFFPKYLSQKHNLAHMTGSEPKFITLFSCLTQLRMKFFMPMNN